MVDSHRDWFLKAKELNSELSDLSKPPETGGYPGSEQVISRFFVSGTRGYIERVVAQINGTYESGYYDSCAVMLRRLLETLIIEVFEAKGLDQKIKNKDGDFFHLRDLVEKTLGEPSWNLGRGTKKALRDLKDLGDKSAHNRRFNAHRSDLDRHIGRTRDVVQELIYLSGMRDR